MSHVVDFALAAWDLEGAPYTLAADRENKVYRVETDEGAVALRLHRPNYRSDAELRSELEWMAALSKGGLAVPSPIPSRSGAYLVHIDGVQVDALGWLPGNTLSDCLDDLSSSQREEVFRQLGAKMAALHNLSDAWQIPPDFERVRWDIDGLVGASPLWDRFWDNPGLDAGERACLLAFRERAGVDLRRSAHDLDLGLIHADLVPTNVLFDHNTLSFIDFDDGGWGFRAFDVATALLKHGQAPDYDALEAALLQGYRSQRHFNDTNLDLMMCLRAVTYIGWNITRMTETGGSARNERFIRTAVDLCSTYLGEKTSRL